MLHGRGLACVLFFFKKLRNVENRYKDEIDDLHRRYEQVKAERDKLEKHLREVRSIHQKTGVFPCTAPVR